MPVTIVDHTADIRLRAQSRSIQKSLLELSNFMLSLIYEGTVKAEERISSTVIFSDAEGCVVSLLSDLIYNSDVRMMNYRVKLLRIDKWKIYWEGYGERFDESRHQRRYVIKAATYDRIIVDRENGIIEITLDI